MFPTNNSSTNLQVKRPPYPAGKLDVTSLNKPVTSGGEPGPLTPLFQTLLRLGIKTPMLTPPPIPQSPYLVQNLTDYFRNLPNISPAVGYFNQIIQGGRPATNYLGQPINTYYGHTSTPFSENVPQAAAERVGYLAKDLFNTNIGRGVQDLFSTVAESNDLQLIQQGLEGARTVGPENLINPEGMTNQNQRPVLSIQQTRAIQDAYNHLTNNELRSIFGVNEAGRIGQILGRKTYLDEFGVLQLIQ